MEISFVAGFGPVTRDAEVSRSFWAGAIGLPLTELAPRYWHSEAVPGTKAFAVWPLDQAAESVFGSPEWPQEHAVPQAWLEVDVADAEAVGDAVAELRAGGLTVLRGAAEEPWGQTTSRLLSPEGLLVGVCHTPWMHAAAAPDDAAPPDAG